MGTFSFKMVDSTCYFVKAGNDDVYKLTFVYWGGTGTGAFALDKKIVSLSSVNDIVSEKEALQLFPVPANDRLNVRIEGIDGVADFSVYDLSGRQVFNQTLNGIDLQSGVEISLDLNTGLYVARLQHNQTIHSQKLMVQ
jgi:hypothetical protein